jgi:hypothetical protein
MIFHAIGCCAQVMNIHLSISGKMLPKAQVLFACHVRLRASLGFFNQ